MNAESAMFMVFAGVFTCVAAFVVPPTNDMWQLCFLTAGVMSSFIAGRTGGQ
jgi:hypothetical protein